ncbi:MAG TPA: hypothetical protein VNF07_03545 [Acidimicrobiales bacterium]|nr:hypothetical protein [Acidimicrobiales bacterium]
MTDEILRTLDDHAAVDDPPPAPATAHRRVVRHWQAAAGGAGALVLLYLLDLSSNRLLSVTPDGATALLEGSSIAHGNVGLHGWALSLDSFWGVDAAFYALVVRIVGVRVDLLHFVPALLTVLVVATALLLAREGRRGLPAAVAGGVVVALLAFPSPDLSYYLLQGPWHVGTALYCLVAFRLLARGRWDWSFALAVVLLSAALLGDLLTLAFGVVPCLVAGVVASLRRRRVTAGLSAAAAGLSAVGLALAVRAIFQAIGTFDLVNRNIVVRHQQVVANVGHLANRVPALLGVGKVPLNGFPEGAGAFQAAHVAGLVVVLAGVLAALYSLLRGAAFGTGGDTAEVASWRLEDLLLLGIVGDLVLFVWGSPNGHAEYAKYLTPGVVFGVVLAARAAGRLVAGLRNDLLGRTLAALGLAFAAAFAAEFAVALTNPSPLQSEAPLARFLGAHGLTNGVGDYWSASLVTVDTGGKVAVRPVTTGAARRIERFDRQSSADWYAPGGFQFLVYDTSRPWHGVDARSAAATYGRPARTWVVGSFRVLTWSHPFSVALPPAPRTSPLNILWGLGDTADRGAGQWARSGKSSS